MLPPTSSASTQNLNLDVQRLIARARAGGDVNAQVVQEVVDRINTQASHQPSLDPNAVARAKIQLSAWLSRDSAAFDQEARRAALSYAGEPLGRYAAAAVLSAFDQAPRDPGGQIGVLGAGKLLEDVVSIQRNSRSREPLVRSAARDYLRTLIQAQPESFSPEGLGRIRVALGLPLGKTVDQMRQESVGSGVVTEADVQDLLRVPDGPGLGAASREFLLDFYLKSNRIFEAGAAAAIKAALGVTSDSISYSCFDSLLATVLPSVVAGNRINSQGAELLSQMARHRNGITDTARRDLGALLLLYEDRIDSDAKEILQRRLSCRSTAVAPQPWVGSAVLGGVEERGGVASAAVRIPAGDPSLRQELRRFDGAPVARVSLGPVAAFPARIVNGTRVRSAELFAVRHADSGLLTVELVARAPRGPSRQSGVTGGIEVFRAVRDYSGDELLAGRDLRLERGAP
jgi:hypothetical protein